MEMEILKFYQYIFLSFLEVMTPHISIIYFYGIKIWVKELFTKKKT